ncbi:MAG: 1-deoxy-D-xylulose-5-phosphate synthase [Alphaproteobacteria bacterium]|nr:1-deoxy-D-xylulose-5-phosphate synthase [Alphaproteobacteria bacterium]
MYIEDKSEGLSQPGRIGLVVSSRSGRTLTWNGRSFLRVGSGYKYNHVELGTGAPFWISGPRRDGADGLYERITRPEDVDPDVAAVYWREIRGR